MGFWEVDEVVPIVLFTIKPLGVTSTLLLYCHAMLVDVVWVSESMTDVRLLINGLLKVATLIQVWMDCLWAPGESSVVLGYLGVPM